MDWEEARAEVQGRKNGILRAGGVRLELANIKSDDVEDSVKMFLHGELCLIWYKNGELYLSNSAMHGRSVVDRLNQYLPYGWRIHVKKPLWFLHVEPNRAIPWSNGMCVDKDGQRQDGEDDRIDTDAYELVSKVRAFSWTMFNRLAQGEISGEHEDCDDCRNSVIDRRPRATHLLEHVERETTPSELVHLIVRRTQLRLYKHIVESAFQDSFSRSYWRRMTKKNAAELAEMHMKWANNPPPRPTRGLRSNARLFREQVRHYLLSRFGFDFIW